MNPYFTRLRNRGYDARDEAYFASLEDGHTAFYEPVRRPNKLGYRLIGLWRHYVTEPIRIWRQMRCKHPNMVDHSYFNGDTGHEEHECPDCGLYFSHTHY